MTGLPITGGLAKYSFNLVKASFIHPYKMVVFLEALEIGIPLIVIG